MTNEDVKNLIYYAQFLSVEVSNYAAMYPDSQEVVYDASIFVDPLDYQSAHMLLGFMDHVHTENWSFSFTFAYEYFAGDYQWLPRIVACRNK